MKAGIVTHYNVHNHGAQLQLYALSSQLGRYGIEAKALRYKKNYDFIGHGLEAKYSLSLRSVPLYIRYLFEKGLGRTFYNIKKKKTLDSFRAKKGLEGEYYSEATDLDCAVIGSDEIFSIEPGLNPCFWGMGIPCDRVISYAASFGPTDAEFIARRRAEEFIRAGIERIDRISVRDRNSYDIIKHYSDRDAEIVCDPVLLYDFAEEREQSAVRVGSERYCVVYSYDDNMNDEESVAAVKSYAKKHGLKIYSVGFYHKWCDKNIHADPLELFSWFSNADIVFTNTFHGSVISLVSGAQFFVKIGANKNKLAFLLEQYGVSDRQVSSFAEAEQRCGERIDYSAVCERIEQVRKRSLSYLESALGVRL